MVRVWGGFLFVVVLEVEGGREGGGESERFLGGSYDFGKRGREGCSICYVAPDGRM